MVSGEFDPVFSQGGCFLGPQNNLARPFFGVRIHKVPLDPKTMKNGGFKPPKIQVIIPKNEGFGGPMVSLYIPPIIRGLFFINQLPGANFQKNFPLPSLEDSFF